MSDVQKAQDNFNTRFRKRLADDGLGSGITVSYPVFTGGRRYGVLDDLEGRHGDNVPVITSNGTHMIDWRWLRPEPGVMDAIEADQKEIYGDTRKCVFKLSRLEFIALQEAKCVAWNPDALIKLVNVKDAQDTAILLSKEASFHNYKGMKANLCVRCTPAEKGLSFRFTFYGVAGHIAEANNHTSNSDGITGKWIFEPPKLNYKIEVKIEVADNIVFGPF